MQRLTPDHLSDIEEVTIEKDQTQMIWRKKCSAMLNKVPILEYNVSKRVGPSQPPISMTVFRKKIKSSCETTRSILYFARIMISMYCESKNQRIPPIPGWSGFNILLLHEKIPARIKIGYWPLANSNPSQVNTVNAVFLESLANADELETGCIILTFGLAFQAMVLQVHWNDAMYTQRTVVRLCDLHICIFLSVIQSASKIQSCLPSYLKRKLWHKGHYMGSCKPDTTIEVSDLWRF